VIVLGFDTATAATAVALRLSDGSTLRARDDPGIGQRPGHTTRLLPLARELLAQAELSWGGLERIAVGVGPGTFTGLRIGVATARGLAQALGIDTVGISTPRVLAQAAIADPATIADLAASIDPAARPAARAPARAKGDGVLAVIDARRGEAFVAAFVTHERSSPPGARGDRPMTDAEGLMTSADGPAAGADAPQLTARELSAVRALAPQELAGAGAAADPSRKWRAVGDGAVRFRAELEAAGIAVAADDSPLHRVDAGVLCELALAAPHGAPETVLPDYRRRPDAEIALKNAQQ
jgi:tRNA threonylcarbamoyladenosine biosynthesis protein TsaB